jgi:hypothetical protein
MATRKAREKFFPDYGEVEYEQSIITIPLYLTQNTQLQPKGEKAVLSSKHPIITGGKEIGRKGMAELKKMFMQTEEQPAEILNLTAYMRLVRGAPIVNTLGIKQFEFQIDAWELVGYSKVLGKNISFCLSRTVQPVSICMSEQAYSKGKSDYPARIIYSAVYDIYLNDERIVANQPGIAFATGVRQIPPRDVKVAFEKPIFTKLFWWRSGCCWFMKRITRAIFEKGAAESQRIRESSTYRK